MCHDELSNADVNAIRENRGFSEQETASRALLENFYLSDIGVEAALNTLTHPEVVFLHWLAYIDKEVPITAFIRIYKSAQGSRYATYTERYKPVFEKVRRTLIRKGVLLFAEDHSLYDANTKNERRRYRFPRQFARFLPPLIQSPTKLAGAGERHADLLRRKLKTVIPGEPPIKGDIRKDYELQLVNGDLYMGAHPFKTERLLEWQRVCWSSAMPFSYQNMDEHEVTIIWRSDQGYVVPPIQTVTYVFSRLAEDEWLRPGQLSQPLRVFCNTSIKAEDICESGWRWGCLVRQTVDDVTYYRPATIGRDTDVTPQDYLCAFDEQDLLVNLETIPYPALDLLKCSADLRVADVDGPYLTASPSLVKIGRSLKSLQGQALTAWLQEHAPTFRRTLEMAEARWGKQIVHQHLLIAQVNDLGLRVQMEETFQDPLKVRFLPNDYIVCPRDMLKAVRKVVAGAGHVIKEVTNDA